MKKFLATETQSFSKWFKVLVCVLFALYVISWFFTIHLSRIQVSSGLEPVMPIANMDSTEYRNLVESMLSGNGFSQFGYPNTLQSPGYPFFAAVLKYLTGSYFAVTLVQVCLVFAAALIIRRLGILFYSQRAGEIAASLFLLNPIVWALALTVMTDILFLFLFTLGFYLASTSHSKIHTRVITPLIFAAAIYVRPMGVLAIPIFIAPYLISQDTRKDKITSIAIMISVVVILAIPWVYRNYRISAVADFSSFRSANLGLYAAPMFLSSIHHTDVETEKAKIAAEIGIPVTRWRDLQYSKEVSRAAMEIILKNPFSYIRYHLITSISFLFSSSIQYVLETYAQAMHLPTTLKPGAMTYLISHEWKLFIQSIGEVWWKIAERIIWLFIYAFAVFGMYKERSKKATWAMVGVVLYLMLLAGPLGNARYAMQSLVFKVLLCGAGVVWVTRLLKKDRYV